MKKNILLILMSLSFFIAADAQAQEWCNEDSCCYEDSCCVNKAHFYAKFFSGANFLQNNEVGENEITYQTGYIIAGSLGYRWCNGLRLEAEYAFRRNAIKEIDFITEVSSEHGHFHVSSYMANLLWDLPLSSWRGAFCNIRSFVGAGIGYDYQKIHSSNSRIVFDQKWNHFSWQVMAGLAYPLFCNTDLTLEYKFHQGSCHFHHNSVGVGLVYKFGRISQ